MLVELKLSELASIVGGKLFGADAQVLSVIQDTRKLDEGALYVAIKGERFDGHNFIAQAQDAKACGALVEKIDESLPEFGQVLVEDSLAALSKLAAWHREQFTGLVVAITGSAGKTTSKELMASVLNQSAPCLMTQGNLNNHIGVPLTLMSLKAEHKFAVIELGASSEGEIATTASLAKPDVGIITNASEAHLEGFKDLATVVKTKGELLDFIQTQGTAIINKTDSSYDAWQKRANTKSLSFGLDSSADVYAECIEKTEHGCSFTLRYLETSTFIKLPILGEHNVLNALSVSAAALALGLNLESIAQGLNQSSAIAGRLTWVSGINQSRLLDDSYNASPASVYAAIDVLAQFEASVLVLGELGELGSQSQDIHQAIGEYTKAKGIKRLLCYGEKSRYFISTFGEKGDWFANQDLLIEALKNEIDSHSVVLIKGSRSSAMDKVVSALADKNKIGESPCCYG